MVWNASLPADNTKIRNAPTVIRANQDAVAANIDANHVALTDPSGGGKHKFLQMPAQGAAPITAADEGGVYTKDDGTRTALYWRQENNGTEVKLTGPDPSAATSGYTFLPGGLLLQWATKTGVNSGATIAWPTPFGTFYSATLSRREDGSNDRGFVQFDSTTSPNATQFVVRIRDSSGSQINNQTIYFVAIGTQP